MITSQALRDLFLNYFESKGHTCVPASSLIPENDSSLLFTNAGMVPFKHILIGQVKAPYACAVSVQPCLRAGGKHNDLDQVGYTARHHTFFEMLGNFSFGAYFKREAIQYAWTFLTQILKLSPEKLWITVFEEDKAAAAIWLNEIKVDPMRFSYCGAKDNFWSMGDTGPCGPCTEIFYDHGPAVAGGPPGTPYAEGDRFVEIWNLVFMQYERTLEGKLEPLPKPCVDTGMGLERLAAVMQGVTNNYETDIFRSLIQAIEQKIANNVSSNVVRVIADHMRAASFLITDGINMSNEGRGYVLRRIVRRAARHGYQAGLQTPFLYQLTPILVNQMGETYPTLKQAESQIYHKLLQEEQQFERTLHHGMKCFEQAVTQVSDNTLSGAVIFKLYDTYGFPVDLTADLARERGLTLDISAFDKAMAIQKGRSQAASNFTSNFLATAKLDAQATEFKGYQVLDNTATIISLFKGDKPVSQLQLGDTGIVVLDQTPFYAESGGQIGDCGQLVELSEKGAIFEVSDTQKQGSIYLHKGQLIQGTLQTHSLVQATVNPSLRKATAQNHTATHLLHAALRQVLGNVLESQGKENTISQKGSLVTSSHLRFDFTYDGPITNDQINKIESLVNQQIIANKVVKTRLMSLSEAQALGAIALVGEKYDQTVRVLQIDKFSMELCGGTHVAQTGELGLFKITANTGIAAGIRRLEAVTGEAAFKWCKALEQQLQTIASELESPVAQIAIKLKKQKTHLLEQTQKINSLRQYLWDTLSNQLLAQVVLIQDVSLLVAKIPDLAIPDLRIIIDQLKLKLPTAAVIVLIGTHPDHTIQLGIGVSPACTARIKANKLASVLAECVDGKGGGRIDFAQIRGHDLQNIGDIMKIVSRWVEQHA